ncbi:Endo-1,4-beta-xylanase [Cecembia lonarensis LW9]|uniref:Beta-xylanase n=2 Tax=Cecembia TaxID=1187078 RepID=K1KYP9_CECL9|nr:Endo-1,4-beta-xylanase [Cecembia lonarensis LW9]
MSPEYKMKASLKLIMILAGILICQPVFSQDNGLRLKEIFKDAFYIGTAISYRQASGEEQQAWPLLEKHFNSITSENMMKWGPIHPEPDRYNFVSADQFVELGKKMNAFIIGHTLVWHQQTPKWVYQNEMGESLMKEALLERMEKHIETLVGRYKGQVHGWDVVNEVFEDDGSYRESEWYQITGRDYIFKAFQKVHEMDPEAELYYNDYNLWKPEKREAAIALAQELRKKGLRVDGIGMQGHYMLDSPPVEMIEASIIAISNAGFKVMVTELDVDVLPRPRANEGADLNKNYALDEKFNPYTTGLSESIADKFAKRYTDIFSVFLKHQDKISRITFWGLHDGASWLNNWPVRGRTNYPLLFDRNFKGKEEVIQSISPSKF